MFAVVALVTACAAQGSQASQAAAPHPNATRARQSRGASPGPRLASHVPVVLIVMENHESSAIVGSRQAPYINHLIRRGRLFTRYTAVSHPSLPNYLAMTSGATRGKVGTDSVTAGQIHGRNLFAQLSRAHVSWHAFEDSMPSPCYRPYSAGTFPQQYALKHDPAMTYTDVAGSAVRCGRVVPFGSIDPSRLPRFSFVTPNLCHDMHSCGIAAGDRWLHGHVPALLSAGALVVITFDEGSSNIGGGGRVALIEAGRGIRPGVKNGNAFDHYSLLAGLERRFGLRRLANARHARPLPL